MQSSPLLWARGVSNAKLNASIDYNKTVQERQLVKGKISPFPVLILPVICVAQCDCQRLHLRQHFVSYLPE